MKSFKEYLNEAKTQRPIKGITVQAHSDSDVKTLESAINDRVEANIFVTIEDFYVKKSGSTISIKFEGVGKYPAEKWDAFVRFIAKDKNLKSAKSIQLRY